MPRCICQHRNVFRNVVHRDRGIPTEKVRTGTGYEMECERTIVRRRGNCAVVHSVQLCDQGSGCTVSVVDIQDVSAYSGFSLKLMKSYTDFFGRIGWINC